MNTQQIAKPLAVAAGAFGTYSLLLAATRPWHRRWGASEAEVAQPLPGDELMEYAACNHAITIEAPADRIWPWLVQIGQNRGGFYSYTWLENLVRADIHNSDRIVSRWQKLRKGDFIRLASAEVYGDRPLLRVADIEPNHFLVLEGWGSFVLEPVDEHATRLIIRSHGRKSTLMQRLIGFYFLEPAHFIMERKMLLGIKQRAELGYRNEQMKPRRRFPMLRRHDGQAVVM